jgi:UDP-N-acetylglucosamine 2-epimerase (non-hydrolysing)
LGYVEFMCLLMNAAVAITDSGGLQEETSYLGIPCLTLRENTERPITITEGTNRLVTVDTLVPLLQASLSASKSNHRRLALWDGKTAQRVAASLKQACQKA